MGNMLLSVNIKW